VCFVGVFIRDEHDDNNGRNENKKRGCKSHSMPCFGKAEWIANQVFDHPTRLASFFYHTFIYLVKDIIDPGIRKRNDPCHPPEGGILPDLKPLCFNKIIHNQLQY
jgi:hypothetical protein